MNERHLKRGMAVSVVGLLLTALALWWVNC